MKLIRCFTNESLDIHYDPETHLLHVDWKGYQSEESIKHGCEVMLRMMVTHGCYKIVNDNTLVRGIFTVVAEWGGTVWFPAMARAGMKKFAWIYSPAMLSQLSANEVISFLPNSQIPIKTFYDKEQAIQWLLDSKH
jgi:hypothetical protein